MKKILIVAEHDHQSLKLATHHAVGAATQLDGEADILLIGSNCAKAAEQACLLPSVRRVLVADNEVYEHQLAENSAALIAEVGKQYDYILTGATTFGKNLLPRAAALLDVAVVSDVTKIITPDTFERPTYAGNAIATVKLLDTIKMLTIRITAFQAVHEARQPAAELQALTQVIPNAISRFQSQSLTQSKRPDLTAARVIISGGRGLKSAENFHMLETIADRLGAAVGASRAAVDAGFAPNDYQVGQTGKVVAPDLYIAVGISGAIQHLAGMKDSKIIVAINNDPEAPIFQVADYGLVGDLFKILPELQNELDKVMS
ncbi:Electron transfer flavoprotein subunit alpha [Aquicella siphonis]|uniref:Electron transfer flavoprotein subunit alpha n=2 Tax=Aquicella siphonis TaxID=254247 RepID=A0A5E4PL83_9COXI|nr:Electron transfer flavoprotein subunit alpha [Aquicella siphonis]